MKIKLIILSYLAISLSFLSFGQNIQMPKEMIMTYSQQWKGERFPDGRPKVSDDLVKRLANISIEEAWGVMRGEGYESQFEGNWHIINPNKPLAGRVLTAQYMPMRPDINTPIMEKGKSENRKGASNSWPIDLLQENDVYVADGYGKIIDGTLIGDNLGNSIYAKSKTGVVFDAGIRDLEGLEAIDGFVGFVRGMDPSFIKNEMLTGINYPIRIGRATVLPGDLILGKKEGVIFIPAHLAEKVISTSEFIGMTDAFGHLRLKQGKYTPGQIDQKWTDDIKADFVKWADENPDKRPMSKAELAKILKDKNW